VATRGHLASDHDVGVVRDAAEAVSNTHDWFARNDGWAPPDADTLADWAADGMCRSPDECLVTPGGWCEHGLASWWLVLRSLASGDESWSLPRTDRLDPRRPDYAAIFDAHDKAVARGEPGYEDPSTGLFVMTAPYLADRGHCCDQGCRHCPYPAG